MKKEQLQGVANDVFKRYADKEKVFITSDGQAFFNESDAKNHAAKNRTGKELEVFTFRRTGEAEPAKKNAKETIADISTAETVEAVTALLETEKAGENRKSVLEAAEKRIAELQKTEQQ